MNNKLLMLKGLPSSGKSTFCKEELIPKGWKRVNKDELRAMIDDSKHSKSNEKEIIEARDLIIIHFLDNNYNVVVDDTNFSPIHAETLAEIAEHCDAEFEEKFFDVPLGECIDRDSKRGDKSVGADVINKMYERYIYKKVPMNVELQDCYIFDIDNTLSIMGNRSPYEFDKVHLDSVNEEVLNVLKSLSVDSEILILSGREDSCRKETEDWLNKIIRYGGLFMRNAGDKRSDNIIKRELYEAHIKDKYNVLGVFDDRQSVCRLWYELGLPLFRVGNPNSCF